MVIDGVPAIKLSGVRKEYGDMVAVEGLDLEVRHGEILGLLGPNGSGKSTTIKMMMGLVKPTRGSVNILGIDASKDPIGIKKQIGYVPESPRIYEFLTALEFLDLTGDLYGMTPEDKMQRIKEFIEAFDLEGREGDIISSYSDGMKQKTAIISALMHRPRLLLLDEPLRGLDPKSAKIMKDLLNKLASQGVTTVVSTHTLEIAQAMCTRIAIIYNGRLLALGTMEELRQAASMPGSGLEDIFLKLTGTGDIKPIVEALIK
ncbi:ABC-type multidrug transport system, ATPase component [Methanocella conradii HZ254]|uniref:ABC-type multidrug transport system, ATPase component n=1 Tax=Methanocella conradii (strain DSM 24694 / JCM 17849 / CGMCC 1.5162 / HZ254) TaxID=1041930 RepID=H8I7G5_METCZ|nr:ABC transporter ATP-binding protein [Methanocella conradii]AFD00831.1 ABC-type multidrug transport system, ATPase component [Methanocella conradii HZ254]